MLHRGWFVAVLLLSMRGELLGADAAGRFTVSFAAPKVVNVTDLNELATVCRTYKSVTGCTFFAEERLSCNCERQGNAWVLVATATAAPVMYLTDPSVKAHEDLHIVDIKESLHDYLRRLTASRFATDEACFRTAGREIVAFGKRMNFFRSRSNWRLH